MTQTEHVLALLRARGVEGLTPKAALALVGTMRLAARIADLRAAGHDIRTETLTTNNGARVARYVLVPHKVAPTWDEMRAAAADMIDRRRATTGETRKEATKHVADYLRGKR